MDIRFWNVDPLRHSSSVFCKEAAEFTGEEGSIHPVPVPSEPGVEKMFKLVDDDDDDERALLLMDDGVKALAVARKPHRAMEDFMVIIYSVKNQ